MSVGSRIRTIIGRQNGDDASAEEDALVAQMTLEGSSEVEDIEDEGADVGEDETVTEETEAADEETAEEADPDETEAAADLSSVDVAAMAGLVAEARAEGVAAERDRWLTVLDHQNAQGRPNSAKMLLKSGLETDKIIETLAGLPKEGGGALATAMEMEPNPDIDTSASGGDSMSDEDSEVKKLTALANAAA